MSLKTPVLGIDRSSVVTIHFNLLKKAKNVLDAKNNNFPLLEISVNINKKLGVSV